MPGKPEISSLLSGNRSGASRRVTIAAQTLRGNGVHSWYGPARSLTSCCAWPCSRPSTDDNARCPRRSCKTLTRANSDWLPCSRPSTDENARCPRRSCMSISTRTMLPGCIAIARQPRSRPPVRAVLQSMSFPVPPFEPCARSAGHVRRTLLRVKTFRPSRIGSTLSAPISWRKARHLLRSNRIRTFLIRSRPQYGFARGNKNTPPRLRAIATHSARVTKLRFCESEERTEELCEPMFTIAALRRGIRMRGSTAVVRQVQRGSVRKARLEQPPRTNLDP